MAGVTGDKEKGGLEAVAERFPERKEEIEHDADSTFWQEPLSTFSGG